MILSQDTFNFCSSVLLLYNHPKAILKQQFIILHKSVSLEFCEGSRWVIFLFHLEWAGFTHLSASSLWQTNESGRSKEALFMYLGPHLFSTWPLQMVSLVFHVVLGRVLKKKLSKVESKSSLFLFKYFY